MLKEGRSKVDGASCEDQSVPYSTIARRERSRKLAQRRRDTYKTIMDDLTGVCIYACGHLSLAQWACVLSSLLFTHKRANNTSVTSQSSEMVCHGC